jgi:hypothetical protein
LVETEADPKAGHAFEDFNDIHPPLLWADAVPGISVRRATAAARLVKEESKEDEMLFLP